MVIMIYSHPTFSIGQYFLSLKQKHTKNTTQNFLVGGFNPFEKYVRQIGSFPQVGVRIKNI